LRGVECAAPDKYAEAFYSRKIDLGMQPGKRGKAEARKRNER
jgi:hypothetical protein